MPARFKHFPDNVEEAIEQARRHHKVLAPIDRDTLLPDFTALADELYMDYATNKAYGRNRVEVPSHTGIRMRMPDGAPITEEDVWLLHALTDYGAIQRNELGPTSIRDRRRQSRERINRIFQRVGGGQPGSVRGFVRVIRPAFAHWDDFYAKTADASFWERRRDRGLALPSLEKPQVSPVILKIMDAFQRWFEDSSEVRTAAMKVDILSKEIGKVLGDAEIHVLINEFGGSPSPVPTERDKLTFVGACCAASADQAGKGKAFVVKAATYANAERLLRAYQERRKREEANKINAKR